MDTNICRRNLSNKLINHTHFGRKLPKSDVLYKYKQHKMFFRLLVSKFNMFQASFTVKMLFSYENNFHTNCTSDFEVWVGFLRKLTEVNVCYCVCYGSASLLFSLSTLFCVPGTIYY